MIDNLELTYLQEKIADMTGCIIARLKAPWIA